MTDSNFPPGSTAGDSARDDFMRLGAGWRAAFSPQALAQQPTLLWGERAVEHAPVVAEISYGAEDERLVVVDAGTAGNPLAYDVWRVDLADPGQYTETTTPCWPDYKLVHRLGRVGLANSALTVGRAELEERGITASPLMSREHMVIRWHTGDADTPAIMTIEDRCSTNRVGITARRFRDRQQGWWV